MAPERAAHRRVTAGSRSARPWSRHASTRSSSPRAKDSTPSSRSAPAITLTWRPDRIIPDHRERPPDGRQARAEVAAGVAEPADGPASASARSARPVAAAYSKAARKLALVGGGGVDRRGLGIRAHLRLDPRRDRRVVAAMPVARRVLLAVFREQLGRVLAQALEHRELGGAAAVAAPDQALLDERGGGVHHVGHVADLLGRVQRPPSDEHRRPAEQCPLVRAQQVVAPGQRRPQGPVPGRARRGPRWSAAACAAAGGT